MTHMDAWNNKLSCKLRIYDLSYLFTLIEFILLTRVKLIFL